MNDFSSEQHPMRFLGVFAHPDDEIFCAGGTFAKYVAAGAEAMVVSASYCHQYCYHRSLPAKRR
jgi:LmbE family N-acetylglucosaminyl deacetylase